MSLLKTIDLSVRHGQLRAVQGVSLSIEPGEMLFLVGANGAGKTTLLRSIAGDHRHAEGCVMLAGRDIGSEPAHQRARAGLCLVPEGRRLFAKMSVRENLELGKSTARAGPWTVDAVYEVFPMLARHDQSLAGTLSGGEQQAVAIGRALMGNPVAVLLDEVSLGLSPAAVDAAYEALASLKQAGLALLVVEQDLARALNTADDLMVMCEGRVMLHARPGDTSLETVAAASFGQPVEVTS